MNTTIELPLTAGTWAIDPSHSSVSFTVRHLMISKVRGSFGNVVGSVTVTNDLAGTLVDVTIDPASIDTGEPARDAHLRNADFLDVAKFGQITVKSTAVEASKDGYRLVGDLTIRGIAKSVQLAVEFDGTGIDPWGNTKAGFSASGEINRKDWGIEYNAVLEAGGVLIGEQVKLQIDAQLVQPKAN